MPEYERTTSIDAGPDQAFRYLSDPKNLPRYVATMVLAEPEEGDRLRVAAHVQGRHEEGEASLRAEPAARRMEWGSQTNAHYQGSLEVSVSGEASSVTVRISTDRQEDADEIDRVLDETMANIKTQLEPH